MQNEIDAGQRRVLGHGLEAAGAQRTGLACFMRFVARSGGDVGLEGAVLELDHIGAGGEKLLRQRAGFVRRLGNLAHRQRGLEAGRVALGAAEMPHAGESAGPANLAVIHRLAMGEGEFFALADIDAGGDALIEHQFAVIPKIIELRIPQAGQHPFAGGVDDLGAGGQRHLAGPAHRRDLIALDDDDGIGQRARRPCRRSACRRE